MNPRLAWSLALALVVVALAVSAWVYPGLPPRVPIHWNLRGEVDGYGPAWVGAFLMPALILGILGMFAVLPWLSPPDYSIDRFGSTYRIVMVLTVVLMTTLHLVILAATVGWKFDQGRVIGALIFGFLGLTGLFLNRVRRNFYVGIKVPWTLASDRVWDDTHRLASRVWPVCGLLGALLCLVGLLPWAIGVLVVMVLVPILYSVVLSKRLEAQGEL